MSDKRITWGLGVVIITLFIIFFLTQNYGYDRGNHIENTMIDFQQAVEQDNWEKANKLLQDFNGIWKSVKYLVSLNNGEQDFSDMTNSIESLKGAVQIRDASTAVQMSRLIAAHWKNFRKVVPEP